MRLTKVILVLISFIAFLFGLSSTVMAADRLLREATVGSVVKFNNLEWYVIGQNRLMTKSYQNGLYYDEDSDPNNVWDPTDSDSEAWRMNNTYFNSMLNNNLIENSTWNVGPVGSESSKQVTAKVGLLTVSEWQSLKVTLFTYPVIYDMWLLTEYTANRDYAYSVTSAGNLSTRDVTIPNNIHYVINLKDGLYINSNDEIYQMAPQGNLSNAEIGDHVYFGGKEWIVVDPVQGELLLENIYTTSVYDSSGTIPTIYYNPLDNTNIAYNLNNTFYNILFNKEWIQDKVWTSDTGYSVTAKVGLLEKAKFDSLSGRLLPITSGTWYLLDSYFNTTNRYTSSGNTINTNPLGIRPTIYLVSGAKVDSLANIKYNEPPEITLSTTANQTISASGTVTLSGVITDPDNDNVTITATINGITKTININSAPASNPGANNWTLSWTASELAQGSYTNITITANDTRVSSTVTFNATITVDKTAPIVNITGPNGGNLNAIPLLFYTANEGIVVVSVDGTIKAITSGQSLGALSDGQHTVTVTSTDAAGNQTTASVTFYLDRVAPIVNLSSIPGGATNDNTPQINYLVSDGTIIVKVDGTVVSNESGDSLAALADGSHTVTVESTDSAGNLGIASITFSIDSTPPTVNIANPSNGTFTNSPLFVYTISDGLVTVKLDGVVTPLISGNAISGISDGVHTIYIEARDTAGNIGTATTSFTVDSTAPIITVVPPPGNSTSDNTPLLNYTVSDGAVVVKVDGQVVNKVSGDSLETLSEGSHTVTVESTDAAGNKGTASIIFTVDSTPPTIGITSPLDGSTIVDDTPQLNFSASEGTAVVRVDGVIANKISGQSLNSLVDGPHTIVVEAIDAAGNRGSASSTFTVDRGAPMVFISAPLNGALIKDKNPQLNYNVSDGNVIIKVDGSTVNKVSGDTLETLTEGIHTLRVESRDTAGNIGSAQISFTVDSTAPNVNITSPANGTTILENTPIISFFNTDGTAIVKVDGTVVSKVTGQKLDTLSNGSHTITVEATDTVGNKGSASSTFTVNAPIPGQTTFGPTVKIISPANEAVTNNRNPQINYSVSEGTVTVKIDGQITNKTSGLALDSLSDGFHTLRVEAIDSKGQIGAAQVIFKVDFTGPSINITSPITGSTLYETKPKLTYAISDGTAVVKVDGTVVSKTSGQNLDNLGVGLHTVTVEATDSVGNASVDQTTFTVSTQTSTTPEMGIPDRSTQIPSYSPQTPDNFKYQYDPFTENTNVAGIEAAPMTEQERDMYFNSQANGQEGPLKVTVSPLGGTFENPQVVNLAVNKPAIIYYTTNGSNPTTESDMFSAPILADQSMNIRYFAKDGDGKSTPIQSQKYTIKNSTKSQGVALKSQTKTSVAQEQQLKKKAQEGEIDSSLILTALGWVMLTTAVGSVLTLKG